MSDIVVEGFSFRRLPDGSVEVKKRFEPENSFVSHILLGHTFSPTQWCRIIAAVSGDDGDPLDRYEAARVFHRKEVL